MKKIITFLVTLIMIFSLTACSNTQTVSSSTDTSSQTSSNTTAVEATVIPIETAVTNDPSENYTWDEATAVAITLNGDSAASSGEGVTVAGSIVTITSAGTYLLSGTLTDGQVIVDTEDEELVTLVLDGVNISNSTSSAIYITNADSAMIILNENTENVVSDAATYVYATADEDEPNAAIFSKANLTIYGSGSLTVNGNYNDGISSKDGLIIASGSITVNAMDDGIRGKDYLLVKSGNLLITAGGDGLKSDNEEDTTLGYISIESGTLNITSGKDGIDASVNVLVSGGEITIVSGGGSNQQIDETTSAKGISGSANVAITGGTFNINSADDTIHSNGAIVVSGGSFVLLSGDDGMHADATLTINGGDIQINQSYEGIESAIITINDGTIHITASDDGVNVAGGTDSSGMMNPGMGGQGAGGGPGGRGQNGGPGTDSFSGATSSYYLYINGGYLAVNAGGDGLDSNGGIVMTNGTVLVNGPTNDGNGSLDYTTGFSISGGFFVATGSSGMAQAPDTTSTQNSLLLNFTSGMQADTIINIQNSAGETILSFSPVKQFQSIAFSSDSLTTGTEYTVSVGGTSTGTVTDSLYQDGVYSGGQSYTTFTVSSVVTQLGSSGGFRR